MAQAIPRGHQARPTQTSMAETLPSMQALSPSVRWLGFWSAVVMVTTYLIFLVGGVGALSGTLKAPWDAYVPYGASILIAPAFVLLIISVHASAPEAQRVWSQAALAFAILYAAFVSIVYVTWLFVVEPHILAHTESQVALLGTPAGSFLELVDGLGYTYMGLAACLTAPIFSGGRLAAWTRGVAIANGPAALLILGSYVSRWIPLGVPGTLLMLVYGVLLAVAFYKSNPTPIRCQQSAAR
jgi:hypothetical protein